MNSGDGKLPEISLLCLAKVTERDQICFDVSSMARRCEGRRRQVLCRFASITHGMHSSAEHPQWFLRRAVCHDMAPSAVRHVCISWLLPLFKPELALFWTHVFLEFQVMLCVWLHSLSLYWRSLRLKRLNLPPYHSGVHDARDTVSQWVKLLLMSPKVHQIFIPLINLCKVLPNHSWRSVPTWLHDPWDPPVLLICCQTCFTEPWLPQAVPDVLQASPRITSWYPFKSGMVSLSLDRSYSQLRCCCSSWCWCDANVKLTHLAFDFYEFLCWSKLNKCYTDIRIYSSGSRSNTKYTKSGFGLFWAKF